MEYPGAGVTGGCESPCGYWVLKLGPLQGQQALVTSESSLPALDLLIVETLAHSMEEEEMTLGASVAIPHVFTCCLPPLLRDGAWLLRMGRGC